VPIVFNKVVLSVARQTRMMRFSRKLESSQDFRKMFDQCGYFVNDQTL
jgi:hypothetical protein